MHRTPGDGGQRGRPPLADAIRRLERMVERLAAGHASHVRIATRVNRAVVIRTGSGPGGTTASARQSAPIRQRNAAREPDKEG